MGYNFMFSTVQYNKLQTDIIQNLDLIIYPVYIVQLGECIKCACTNLKQSGVK